MRISDWSSDVCSSDLDDAEPVARIERAAERHRRLLWDRGHGIDTAGEVGRRYRDGADRAYDYAAPIGAGAGAGRRRDDKLRAVRRSGVLGRREVFVDLVRQRRCEGAVAGLPRHRLARSEEHTSELQSLMRISYAAFC